MTSERDRLIAEIEASGAATTGIGAGVGEVRQWIERLTELQRWTRVGTDPSVPELLDRVLWITANHPSLRHAAARGLASLGEHVRLAPLLDGTERALVAVAVDALLEREPNNAFDTLSPRMEAAPVLEATLSALARGSLTTTPNRRKLEVRDPRWVDVLAPLSWTGKHADTARRALGLFGPEAQQARMRGAPREPLTEVRKAELDGLIASFRPLTARVDATYEALGSCGYRFDALSLARTHPEPLPELLERVERFEGACGRIPLAPIAFWHVIGGVWWTGTHPDWPVAGVVGAGGERVWFTEALCVGNSDLLGELLDDWEPDEPNVLALGPDRLHKAGYSGGVGIHYDVPARAADPALKTDDPGPRETLHGHVVRALDMQGLPGFTTIGDAPREWLAEVARRVEALLRT